MNLKQSQCTAKSIYIDELSTMYEKTIENLKKENVELQKNLEEANKKVALLEKKNEPKLKNLNGESISIMVEEKNRGQNRQAGRESIDVLVCHKTQTKKKVLKQRVVCCYCSQSLSDHSALRRHKNAKHENQKKIRLLGVQ